MSSELLTVLEGCWVHKRNRLKIKLSTSGDILIRYKQFWNCFNKSKYKIRIKLGNKIICRLRPSSNSSNQDLSSSTSIHSSTSSSSSISSSPTAAPTEDCTLLDCSCIGPVLTTQLLTSSYLHQQEDYIISVLSTVRSISFNGKINCMKFWCFWSFICFQKLIW